MKTMFYWASIALAPFILGGCQPEMELSSVDPVNWSRRKAQPPAADSLSWAEAYLPVYSQIYVRTERMTYDLTVTVSMRNINPSDSIYLGYARYYDTHGELIRTYFDTPIYLAPLETVEIVIDDTDRDGGTGANFLFSWLAPDAHPPLVEAVMISASGQQGISFLTRSVDL